jgi:hypothetical protein
MTQTLDAGEGFSQLDSPAAKGAPTSTTQAGAKFGTFAITFGIAFALLYTVYERLNWPLFTYHPVLGILDFGRQPAGVGPPMFWYGWIALSAISALVVACVATIIPARWLRQATVFCCALAVLWPLSLTGLRIFIVNWATFDADFLNSPWVAAIPGFIGTAVITYYFPARLAERLWTSWLLIVPIVGLVVLGSSLLQPWFLR